MRMQSSARGASAGPSKIQHATIFLRAALRQITSSMWAQAVEDPGAGTVERSSVPFT